MVKLSGAVCDNAGSRFVNGHFVQKCQLLDLSSFDILIIERIGLITHNESVSTTFFSILIMCLPNVQFDCKAKLYQSKIYYETNKWEMVF